ncbi:hypothetical protein HYC85_020269 [Camellia sinensis]|uniref:tRNA/rRNA methyltransferase SpoU type domain-containing protein n=1 Tax=Camellia sinensis TaxID=4442 RepID=A0A7J7GQ62_CAMSI|nr:hypothetical protein HYC85_020269 [Camellia sinensis]
METTSRSPNSTSVGRVLEALKNKFHLKILAGHPESNEQSKPVSRLSQGLANSLVNLPLCLVLGGERSGLSTKTKHIYLHMLDTSFLLYVAGFSKPLKTIHVCSGQEKGIHRDELSQKLKTVAY